MRGSCSHLSCIALPIACIAREKRGGINKYKNLWSSPNVTLEEGSSFALSIDHRSTEWQDTPALKLFARKRGGS
jgi:hypothetical protein